MPLTDSHCHLQAPELAGILPEAWKCDVARWVVNGLHSADWPQVASLAHSQSRVLPCFGLHPWYLRDRPASWFEELEEIISRHPGCGLGEFGLDRWMQDADVTDQLVVFKAHWHLGLQRDLPMTVHCLKAWGVLQETLETLPLPQRGFLLHAYGGPVEMVADWVRRGAYFSFSTSFLASNKSSKRAAFQHIPQDRLLIETDAPSMAPPPEYNAFPLTDPATGRQVNHPANLRVAAASLADLRGLPAKEMEEILEGNFQRWWGQDRQGIV